MSLSHSVINSRALSVLVAAALIISAVFPFPIAASTTLTVTVSGGVTSICNDGIDNDSDFLTDYPNDPGCTGATDEDETNTTSSGGGGGGGGAGAVFAGAASVVFVGRAYPMSKVTVLKDGVTAAATTVGSDGLFNIRIDNVSSGSYMFGVYAEDAKGLRSPVVTAGVTVTPSVTTTVSGVFIPPTIDVDKSEVKRGNPISVFGVASPSAVVEIEVNSEEKLFFRAPTDQSGFYSYTLSTAALAAGRHSARASSLIPGQVSGQSKAVTFTVGTRDVAKKAGAALSADISGDGKVNLVDFSIAAYWYKKSNPPASSDLNGDMKVDLRDLSIMASQWTG